MAVAPNATILLIVGSDDDDRIVRTGGSTRIGGASDIFGLLGNQIPFHRLHVTRHYFRQQRRPELGSYTHMVNLITNPEQNEKVLANLRKIARGSPAKMLNPPEAVLRSTRDQVASLLTGIPGLVVPRTVRLRAARPDIAMRALAKANLRFPIILRQAGTHGGRTVGRLSSLDEARHALIDGREYFATEFVDFQSPDGLYRKFREFFIGPKLIFRHMLVSDHWNVHAKDRTRFMTDRPELLAEEDRMFARPEGAFPDAALETLREVRARIRLDFFGMDFGMLRDGQIVLFEANASMNFFPFLVEPKFAYVQKCWAPARQAFRELVGFKTESTGLA